jgi:hypothetical protein
LIRRCSPTGESVGSQCDVGGEPLPLGVAGRRRVEADAADGRERCDQPLVQLGSRGLGDHGRPARCDLGPRAIAVATVGTEEQLDGGQHRPAVRSGEPGQPPHVDQIGEQQGVAAVVERQSRLDHRHPRGVVDR